MGPKKEGWIYIWIPVSWRSRLELMVNIHLIDTFTHLQKILWKDCAYLSVQHSSLKRAWQPDCCLCTGFSTAFVSSLPVTTANLSSFLTCFCCFKTCIVQTSAKNGWKLHCRNIRLVYGQWLCMKRCIQANEIKCSFTFTSSTFDYLSLTLWIFIFYFVHFMFIF